MVIFHEQAYFPAQQPSSLQEARLPPAYAHARGPFDPGFASPQGPRKTFCITLLAQAHRLRARDDFRTTIRRGSRSATSTVVVHVLPDADTVCRAGFVVSKAVGNAVVRNEVKRRLRHLVSGRLGGLPAGASLVIRALPASAGASSAVLGHDLDTALAKALRPRAAR